MVKRGIVALWMIAIGVGAPMPAHAQPAGGDEPRSADAAFEAGLHAVSDGRWEDARREFEAAYRQNPHPRTLFNLAAAQLKTGALVEALESYKQYLDRSAPTEENRESRLLAGRMLERIEASVAHVRLEASGTVPNDVLEIDGHPVDAGAVSRVNPGAHRARILRNGRPVADASFDVPEGGGDHVVRLTAPAPVSASPATRADDSPSVFETWWFWTAVGVVVAAGTVTAVALTSSDTKTASPDQGNLPGWPVAEVP
ncbi:MAG: tetratricopeptide repeat protein [Polyangiales bacterium]|nr:hypothetical protein [Myxococcales bacterium]